MGQENPPFLRRVVLRNYKSIRECDVTLGPLMFLVGPNGSGKSNFLDALRFVADSLRGPMEQAFDKRGGLDHVFSRFCVPPEELRIDLQFNLPGSQTASFEILLRWEPRRRFVVEEENCTVHSHGVVTATYRVREGEVIDASFESRPTAVRDRLYLTIASSFPEFRGLYDLLAGPQFYKINPGQIRRRPFSGRGALWPDGGGIGRVLRRIVVERPELKDRIDEYARAILPSLDRISVESLSEFMRRHGVHDAKVSKEMENYFLWFVVRASERAIYFTPKSMSDGTLHALGVLVALFQCADQTRARTIPLVGIEEPEAALHPSAAGVLFDALHEASHFTQVLVTTHSPDLLDIKDVNADSLLIVDMVDGQSVIGPADEVSRSIMRDRLATAGELLRQNQLRPESQSPGAVGAEAD